MRKVGFTLISLVLGCAASLSGPARSQEPALDPTVWPWSSIGRVNVITGAGSRSHCTGTLIGHRHVLTAAHCLFNKARRVWVDPSSVHFVAGYARGAFKAHAQAAGYVKGPGFVFTEPLQPALVAEDWAVLTLSASVDLEPIKVQPGVPPSVASAQIVRAGYRGDRAHVLTVQRDCSVRAVSRPAPLLLHSCSSVQGELGSALLSFEGGEARIIGILVAGSKQDGAAPSLAVPATTFGPATEFALRPKP